MKSSDGRRDRRNHIRNVFHQPGWGRALPQSFVLPRRAVVAVAAWGAVILLAGADWPQFRGAESRSLAMNERLPTDLGPENVAWVVDLPGQGVSGPIVVGHRVLLSCSSGYRERRLHVLCMDSKSGRPRWQRQFLATGRTMCHPTTAVAAPTPACDGKRVFAFFSSNDLACLDLEGNLLWYRGLSRDFPTAANDVGMASSPLVVGETVVVQLESQGESFAAGLNTTTGETRWRVPIVRQASWTSPVRWSAGGGKQELVLLQTPSGLAGINVKTGKQVWQHRAACSSTASCVVSGTTVFLPASGLAALRPEESQVEVLWSEGRLSTGAASPVVYRERIYTLNRAGVLACATVNTGAVRWKKRLKGTFWATPVALDDNLYCVNQDGVVQIVSLAERGEVIASYDLGESILASPAVADDAIYFRSDRHLWKIADR